MCLTYRFHSLFLFDYELDLDKQFIIHFNERVSIVLRHSLDRSLYTRHTFKNIIPHNNYCNVWFSSEITRKRIKKRIYSAWMRLCCAKTRQREKKLTVRWRHPLIITSLWFPHIAVHYYYYYYNFIIIYYNILNAHACISPSFLGECACGVDRKYRP